MISLFLTLLCLQEPAQPVPIPLPDGIRHSPTLSPDGAWIYFFQSLDKKPENFRKYARNEALFRTPLAGKTVENILEVGDTRGRLHWSPDGTRIHVSRRIADTNGDGEIGFGDGMSLTSADPDGKNLKDLRVASPDSLTIYAITPAGEFILGLRENYEGRNPRIVLFTPGKEEELIAKAWAYYPLDETNGIIRTLKVDQNADGRIGYRDVGTLSLINRKTGDQKPLEASHILRGPIPAAGSSLNLYYAQLQTTEENKIPGLSDNSALIRSDRGGNNPEILTKADSIWIPLKALDGSILLHRTRGNQTEFGLLSEGQEWKPLWKAPEGNQVGFPWISSDQKTILFAVLRDGNKDGELTPGEDPSDLFKFTLK